MADGTIEILGQKLSYPTSWHGTAAVAIVCGALVAILFIVKGWATPETLDKLKDVVNYSQVQGATTENLVNTVAKLNERISAIESKQIVKNDRQIGTVKVDQLQSQIDISKLKEQVAKQNVIKYSSVAPLVSPDVDQTDQIQKYKQQEMLEKSLQNDLSSKLIQLQQQ